MSNPTCSIPGCAKARKGRSPMCSMHATRVARYGTPDGHAQRPSLLERIEMRIVKTDEGCWDWAGYVNDHGYAVLRYGTANVYAHQVIFEAAHGPVPDGHHIDHVCHNTTCCNPKHLRPVTQKQNNENYSGAHPRNKSGYRGVCWHKAAGKWVARVGHNNKMHVAGYFDDVHEAGAAALALRLQLHTHNEADRRHDVP